MAKKVTFKSNLFQRLKAQGHFLPKYSGVPKGAVRLSPYQSRWPVMFAYERHRLSHLLELPVKRIIHFGSTAIPGCSAKPIIDIAIPFDSLRETVLFQQRLNGSAYTVRPVYYLPDRICYTKGEPQQFHLYLVNSSSPTFLNWMLVKEILTKDAALRRQYNRLKQQLAEKFPDQRIRYTEGKTEFIYNLLSTHKKWQNHHSPATT